MPLQEQNKFRNQRVIITVYVPVGKQIRMIDNVGWGNNIHFDGPWNNNDFDIDIEMKKEAGMRMWIM